MKIDREIARQKKVIPDLKKTFKEDINEAKKDMLLLQKIKKAYPNCWIDPWSWPSMKIIIPKNKENFSKVKYLQFNHDIFELYFYEKIENKKLKICIGNGSRSGFSLFKYSKDYKVIEEINNYSYLKKFNIKVFKERKINLHIISQIKERRLIITKKTKMPENIRKLLSLI